MVKWVSAILTVAVLIVAFATWWPEGNLGDPDEACASSANHKAFMTQAVTNDAFISVCSPKPSTFIGLVKR